MNAPRPNKLRDALLKLRDKADGYANGPESRTPSVACPSPNEHQERADDYIYMIRELAESLDNFACACAGALDCEDKSLDALFADRIDETVKPTLVEAAEALDGEMEAA